MFYNSKKALYISGVTLILIIGYLFYVGATSATLATPSYHPPYPPIWGYDLRDYPSIQGFQRDRLHKPYPKIFFSIYHMGDGDYWFVFPTEVTEDVTGKGAHRAYVKDFTVLKFFAGKKETLTLAQHALFASEHSHQLLNFSSTPRSILTASGTVLTLQSVNNSNTFATSYIQQYNVKDTDTTPLLPALFFHYTPSPKEKEGGPFSPTLNDPSVDNFSQGFVFLEDGGCIVFWNQHLIRFSSTFVTSYPPAQNLLRIAEDTGKNRDSSP